ncbi:hypothetical protein FRC18_000463 [Serendipita sp. 400]|nr:hypothetical protein FRC18_000463 [Serendipita sp. 400]
MRSRYFCRTLEAFAEGVHKYIIDIEKWCAERDEAIVQARNGVGRQIVVTLLSLHYDVKSKATATLELLQDILRRLLRSESHHLGDTHHQKDVEMIGFLRAIDFGPIAPHRLSTRLLDFIQDSIDTQLAIGDYHAASKLSELFVATAEPLWKSVGKWMSNGITISLGQGEDEDYFDSLDKELFIRRRSTDFIDPEFWERGYILHTEVESDDDEDEDEEEEKELKQSQITFLVPRIFMAIAEDVLRVGKAVGLLRAIGIEPFHDQEKLSEMRNWCSFSELYQRCETIASISPSTESTEDVPTPYSDQILHLRIVFDTLPSYLLTYLQPWCLAGQGKLNTLLFDDCAMMEHLNSIEGLYFMRRGDAMGIFCDKVFAKLDAHQKWHDLHFLNSVLRDVSAVDRKSWIDFTLVQFTVRGGRQRSNTSTVQCFEGFTADYAVSFPLTYLLRRPSASVYPSIFVLLLQIRRVKVAVEGIALKGVIRPTATEDTADVNSFYALRGKFAWAINCLMNFLATHVIDSHLRRFHGRIKDAQSLDEMIDAHDHYLAQLQMLCFLHSKTTALHRALMSILDLSLHFVQCLEAYMTEQSSSFADQRNVNYAHDEKRKRRRRHQRKARQAGRNVIGFSDVLKPISSDSSSSSDEEVYLEETKDNDDKRAMRRPSLSASISFADASFALKMDRISEELDGLVRYIRKAVDVLAGGTSEAASTFGIFSFMLEDWDM